jgi:hypothetical protein
VAAQLRERYPEAHVELSRGKLLELSVTVDDEQAYDAGPLGYPRPGTVTRRVLERRRVGER